MSLHMWQLQHGAARFELPRFSAVVDPLDPAGGLSSVRVDGHELVGFRPLCVELSRVAPAEAPSIVDAYVRGGDLVVAYADRPRPAMRTEVYWRARVDQQPGVIAAMELISSVQTSLLDSCPRLSMHSDLPAGAAFRLRDDQRGEFVPQATRSSGSPAADEAGQPYCYLFRPDLAGFSYAEMVHPADVLESSGQPSLSVVAGPGSRGPEGFRLRHELFAEKLEKGVILRARVVGVWLERSGDEAATARHYAAFVSEALPLTT